MTIRNLLLSITITCKITLKLLNFEEYYWCLIVIVTLAVTTIITIYLLWHFLIDRITIAKYLSTIIQNGHSPRQWKLVYDHVNAIYKLYDLEMKCDHLLISQLNSLAFSSSSSPSSSSSLSLSSWSSSLSWIKNYVLLPNTNARHKNCNSFYFLHFHV